jgi:general secretion pathway protein J
MNNDKPCFFSSGFTLLEVLLAMALLSIMMVLLFASLAGSAKSWNLGENKIAQVNEKVLTYGFFKRYLQAARAVMTEDSGTTFFHGGRQSLEFISNAPLSSGIKGLHYFKVSYRTVDSGGQLTVAVKPYFIEGEQPVEVDEQLLLERIDTFKIEYFDPAEGVWQAQWSEREQLPALVKISISLLDHSDWPPMIFAIKLAAASPNTSLPVLGL